MHQLNFITLEREMLDPLAGVELTDVERIIALQLIAASSQTPVTGKHLRLAVREATDTKIDERQLKATIRRLRRQHKFPVLSRRSLPRGYWWCTSVEEMQGFIETFRASALDELSTLATIIRHNYPALSGQLKLDVSF